MVSKLVGFLTVSVLVMGLLFGISLFSEGDLNIAGESYSLIIGASQTSDSLLLSQVRFYSCVETDTGLDLTQYGETSVRTIRNNELIFTDVCSRQSDGFGVELVEYYCDGTNLVMQETSVQSEYSGSVMTIKDCDGQALAAEEDIELDLEIGLAMFGTGFINAKISGDKEDIVTVYFPVTSFGADSVLPAAEVGVRIPEGPDGEVEHYYAQTFVSFDEDGEIPYANPDNSLYDNANFHVDLEVDSEWYDWAMEETSSSTISDILVTIEIVIDPYGVLSNYETDLSNNAVSVSSFLVNEGASGSSDGDLNFD